MEGAKRLWHLDSKALNPKPTSLATLNPKTYTLNSKPYTLNLAGNLTTGDTLEKNQALQSPNGQYLGSW